MAAWVIPLALTAVTLGATYLSYQKQQEAASASKKAASIQRQGQDAELRRARVLEIAKARRQRASALAIAEASGVNAVGSSVTGGVNSVTSQSAGNQAFLTSQSTFARATGNQLAKASAAETRAGMYNLLASTAMFGLNTYANRESLFGSGGGEASLLAGGGGSGGSSGE
jgi:hypothetical protein